MTVKIGLDIILDSPPKYLKNKRIGILCNHASVHSRFVHAKNLIEASFPRQLKAVFSPQHGFYGEKQDNMKESENRVDSGLNIPVFSLYGKTRIPTREMFNEIDILLVDLQDVGTRVYTYIYTLSYCLRACKKYDKKYG